MEGIGSLESRVGALTPLRDVDPAALSGDQALAWASQIAQVIHAGEALLAPLAVRLEDLSSGPLRYARWKGYPSAAAMLAGVTGLAPATAGKLVDLGRALTREVEVPACAPTTEDPGDLDFGSLGDAPAGQTHQPLPTAPPVRVMSPLARAARDNVLGTEKIRIIEATLNDMGVETAELEALLVERARKLSSRELRILCLRKFAEIDPEGYAARQASQRKDRELVFYNRPDGMVGLFGRLDAESAGHVKALFDAEVKSAMNTQRDWDEAEQRSVKQINADVLVALARHASGCDTATTRPKTTAVIRMTLESLETGLGFATCDSLEGPISLQTARRMLIDVEFMPIVLGGGSLPLDVGRARRYNTRAQRIAIGERDEGCAMCHAPQTWCDLHHITHWALGGTTDLCNAVMLCVGCHHRVHDCGWIIEVVDGEVTFIPPATVDPQRRRQSSSSARLAA